MQRDRRADQISRRAARRDRNAVFIGVSEHAADLFGRAREHECVRRAGSAPERIALVFRRNLFRKKQARLVRDDAPQSLSVDLHGHFLPVESAAETAALYGYILLVSEQVLIPACLDEVAAELIVEYRLGLVRLERRNDLSVGLDLRRVG